VVPKTVPEGADLEAHESRSESHASISDPMAKPRLVLAPEAVDDPVPPSATATSVPPGL
jgi:hypothetical protein